ncbi:MAG TPA: IclR family transcriptional regulator C-terminal domain-containing protein [Ramlibacter sp.]|nr:IclR family transcriptional regulator C-terminal domain-containing protein [Ramlibacter sp.]
MEPDRVRSAGNPAKTSSSAAAVKSASRVLELLEFAQQVRRPFKAVELREALDWPASSTQMLLQTVVESGYLIFNNQTKHYFPSPRVFALGSWPGDAHWDLEGIFDVLQEIAAETGETAVLSIENVYGAQCVKLVPGRTPMPVKIASGFRAPLTSSAAGLAILTAKSDGQVMTAVQKSRELAARGIESYAQMMKTVHQFRREGRALVYGRLWADSCWISVPTPKPYNMVPATISVGGSLATMKRREDAVTLATFSAISRWRANARAPGRTG